RRPEHRRLDGGDGPGRTGGTDPAVRLLAQPGARRDHGGDRDAAGVCGAVDDPLTGGDRQRGQAKGTGKGDRQRGQGKGRGEGDGERGEAEGTGRGDRQRGQAKRSPPAVLLAT